MIADHTHHTYSCECQAHFYTHHPDNVYAPSPQPSTNPLQSQIVSYPKNDHQTSTPRSQNAFPPPKNPNPTRPQSQAHQPQNSIDHILQAADTQSNQPYTYTADHARTHARTEPPQSLESKIDRYIPQAHLEQPLGSLPVSTTNRFILPTPTENQEMSTC
ncbi:uncharacterized protein BO97DRAFT_285222 [Aspergillus homomorphus CBS 101889]|uniref:Uncharacterized protein n=1 Tax=Aspergillus homomorphus (strain CBS 101889) TaxID=1450537 RepID=A0A395I3V9_ASPHC|nr:hypothetical protein BO97DRAFT_285222 [Aspergillus homomorphus CBS 101889]RAL14445.1 hypothetical protein BO97DRAFT_285222 [Aspergillus homomorphus CBS 101889]